jgi:hypothetical protein
MQDLSPAFIQLHPLGVLATISLIQAGIQQQPEIADREFAKIGIAAARQLQKDLFNQYSGTYKVLEFGWNPEAYILTPSVIAAMMQDIESRRSHKNKIIELISSDEDRDAGCAETLSQQISRRILESQGFNALDM